MTDKKQILNSWKDTFDLKDNSDKLAWMHQYTYETNSPTEVDFSNIMPLIRELDFSKEINKI